MIRKMISGGFIYDCFCSSLSLCYCYSLNKKMKENVKSNFNTRKTIREKNELLVILWVC